MLEVGCRLDLSQESLRTDNRSQLWLEHLERDLTLVLEVVCEVYRSHPALTDLALDAVAAFEGCVQAGDGIWSVQAPKMRAGPLYREEIL